MLTRLARATKLGAALTLETITRAIFDDMHPITFSDRMQIIAACLRVGQLAPLRDQNEEGAAAYQRALDELAQLTTVTRLLALASFYGTRDPAEPMPVSDRISWLGTQLLALVRSVPAYAELHDAYRRQASYIRAAHLALMQRAPGVSQTGILAQGIEALADQRDEAMRERDELRAYAARYMDVVAEEEALTDEEREALRSKITISHDEPFPRAVEDLSHVGAELHEKWKGEEERAAIEDVSIDVSADGYGHELKIGDATQDVHLTNAEGKYDTN